MTLKQQGIFLCHLHLVKSNFVIRRCETTLYFHNKSSLKRSALRPRKPQPTHWMVGVVVFWKPKAFMWGRRIDCSPILTFLYCFLWQNISLLNDLFLTDFSIDQGFFPSTPGIFKSSYLLVTFFVFFSRDTSRTFSCDSSCAFSFCERGSCLRWYFPRGGPAQQTLIKEILLTNPPEKYS